MTKRRSILKIISGLFIGAAPISKLFACAGAGEYRDILVSTPPKNLENFLPVNINNYLNHYYGSRWKWSNNINIKPDSQTNKNDMSQEFIRLTWESVEVIADTNIDYSKNNEYCSNITLIYCKVNGKRLPEPEPFEPACYKILSYNHSKEVLPYMMTRIKMTSKSAEIYAVFTIQDLDTNNIKRINVTKNPLKLSVRSCQKIDFIY